MCFSFFLFLTSLRLHTIHEWKEQKKTAPAREMVEKRSSMNFWSSWDSLALAKKNIYQKFQISIEMNVENVCNPKKIVDDRVGSRVREREKLKNTFFVQPFLFLVALFNS